MTIQRGFGYVVSLQGDPFERPALGSVTVGVFSESVRAELVAGFWRAGFWRELIWRRHRGNRIPHVVTVVQWRIKGFKGGAS